MAWLPSQVRRRCPRFVRSAAQAGSGIVRRAMGSCRRSAVWRRWRRRGIHVCRRIFKCLNRAEGWLHAALVATLAALSAAWISIAVKYLSDLRLGVCQGMFWLDRSFCCGDEQAINYDVNACAAEHSPEVHMDHVVHARWMSWAVWLGLARGGAAAFVVDHLAYVCISTALAGTAAWLVRRFAHRAAGSGIPEIKTALNGFWIPGVLSMWTLVVKCVGLALAASSGLSLGKEGPLVHVACAWAALLDKFRLKVLRRRNPSLEMSDGRLRELLSAACSAGVSVAFGAPLGGVLFALEEVSSHFPPRTLWKCFFCAVVAALTLKSLDSEGTGNLTLFQMDYISLLGSWEPVQIFSFCFLGLIGGALGALFIRLNIAWDRIKTSDPFVSSHPVTVVVAIAVVTSAINYLIPMLKGSSLLLLQQLFGRCGIPGRSSAAVDPFHLCAAPNDPEAEYTDYSLSFGIFVEMTFVLIIRFAQTVFTFGTAVPAGIFIPSLTIGALAGRMVGLVMIKINASTSFLDCHKCIQPGIYALVGAAAVLGGVTRMTISLVVIMFELTGGLAYVVPFMASVMIAKWTADFFEPDGIYDAYIRIKRYPYLSAHDSGHQATFDGTVKDVMRRDFVCLYLEGETFGSATRKLTSVEGNLSLPLVSDASSLYLLGYVEASTLRRSLRHYRTRHEGTNNTVITFSKYAAEWRDVRRKIDRMSSLMPTRPVHAGAYAFGVAAGGEYGRPRSRSESGSSGFGGGNTQALDTRARRSRQGGRYGRVATSGDAEAFADTGVPRLPGVTNRPFADRRASQLRRSSFSDTSMTTSSGDDDEDGGQFAVGEEGDDDGGELSPPSRPASAGLPEGPPNGDRRGGQGSEAAAALQTARTTMTTPSNHHLELVSVDLTFLVCQFTFQLSPDTPLPHAHTLFHNFALSCCFPTTAGRLEGVLTKTDLVQRVMQRQQQQNAEGTTRHRRILRAAAAARRSHWPRLAGIFRRNGGGNAAQQHEQIVLAG